MPRFAVVFSCAACSHSQVIAQAKEILRGAREDYRKDRRLKPRMLAARASQPFHENREPKTSDPGQKVGGYVDVIIPDMI